MRTYTQEEVLKAIKYACSMQKAQDYQDAGEKLIVEEKELKDGVIGILDLLCDSDNNEAKNITIEEINEYLDKGWVLE
jgi:hypothetical protein